MMADLLRHEQGHFDLAQLYARALAAELKSLRVVVVLPLGYTPEQWAAAEAQANNVLKTRAKALLKPFEASMVILNKRYDEQTNHGMVTAGPTGQGAWNAWISRRLGIDPGEDPSTLGLSEFPPQQ